jgi:hypothetical protein
MPQVTCSICGYTKLKIHKGLAMHQTSKAYCTGMQRERRIAEEDLKPSAIAKTTNVANKEQHLDVEGEGPACERRGCWRKF